MLKSDQRGISASAASRREEAVAWVFPLPEVLPEQTRLLLNVYTHTALLLRFEDGELAASHRSFSLTPSATRVFWTLLQAYPAFCSYRSLFASLFPLQQEREDDWLWEQGLALRPVRRALATLVPVLQDFGMRVVSLRRQGYVLAPASEPASLVRERVGTRFSDRQLLVLRTRSAHQIPCRKEGRGTHEC